MKKRRILIALFAVVAVLFALWFLLEGGADGSAEAKYRRFLRTLRFATWTRQTARRAPSFIGKPLNSLSSKWWDKEKVEEKALFESGYLTNASIVLTNASGDAVHYPAREKMEEVSAKMYAAVADNTWLPFVFSVETNHVYVSVTCRTQDVARIAKALAEY